MGFSFHAPKEFKIIWFSTHLTLNVPDKGYVDRCLSVFFWTLYCLILLDLRILITPLVSPNASYSRNLSWKYQG